jgi:hypothetical protein
MKMRYIIHEKKKKEKQTPIHYMIFRSSRSPVTNQCCTNGRAFFSYPTVKTCKAIDQNEPIVQMINACETLVRECDQLKVSRASF